MATIPFVKSLSSTKTPERDENFEPLSANLVYKNPLKPQFL